MAKLSVLMPIYNGIQNYAPGLLVNSIDSILDIDIDLELIVIDDGSFDGTLSYLLDVGTLDRRVIVLSNESNIGQAQSLNRALELSTGAYLWQWSVRAIAQPGAIQLLKTMEDNKHIGFTYGGVMSWGNGEYMHNPREFDPVQFSKRYFNLFYMYRRNGFQYGCEYQLEDGTFIGITDRDHTMQMLEDGIIGRAVKSLCVKYWNVGNHTMTKVQENRKEIDRIFNKRWEHLL